MDDLENNDDVWFIKKTLFYEVSIILFVFCFIILSIIILAFG